MASGQRPNGERELALRYPAVCRSCGAQLAARTRAVWDSGSRTARCVKCVVPVQQPSIEQSTSTAATAAPVALGIAGASAQRLFDRKEARRRASLREQRSRILVVAICGALVGAFIGAFLHSNLVFFAVLGAALPLLKAFSRPQHIDAWRVGAAGERAVGQMLDRLAPVGVVALHDRRVPGRRTNIDHIAVSGAGVFVVDTKNVAGQVTVTRRRITVAGRRQDKMIEGVQAQVSVVRQALQALGLVAPVRGVLCFTKADLPWLKPSPGGIELLYPRGLRRALTRRSETVPADAVRDIAEALARQLPPA